MEQHAGPHAHEHHDGGSSHHLAFETPQMAELAELDGEVLIGFVEQALATVLTRLDHDTASVRRVLDVGSGPGVATERLAAAFPSAEILAVDGSAAMLERARARADRLRVGDRVATRQADLPDGLTAIEPVDLIWASMVLHHVGDETAALRQLGARLVPGGLLCLVEMAGPVRVVFDGSPGGDDGLWDRLDRAWVAWFADMRGSLAGAVVSADYATMLHDAGFEAPTHQVLALELETPLHDQARRFAQTHLARSQSMLGPYASATDLQALEQLVAAGAADGMVLDEGARVRSTRHLYLARRPRTPKALRDTGGAAP